MEGLAGVCVAEHELRQADISGLLQDPGSAVAADRVRIDVGGVAVACCCLDLSHEVLEADVGEASMPVDGEQVRVIAICGPELEPCADRGGGLIVEGQIPAPAAL